MIIKWDEKASSAPMLRTEDRALFKKKVMEMKKRYGLTNSTARLSIRQDMTIFSFAATRTAFEAWRNMPYYQRPLEIKKPFQR